MTATVRNVAGKVSIALDLTVDGVAVKKSMQRDEGETARVTMERIRMLGIPQRGKNHRADRAALLAMAPAGALLTANGDSLDLAAPNGEAWAAAASLQLGGVTVPINYNEPAVTAAEPPPVVYAGLATVLQRLETAFADRDACVFEWRCLPAGAESAEASALPLVGTAAVVTPSEEHLGCRLQCTVRPVAPDGRRGPAAVVVLPAVERPPAAASLPRAAALQAAPAAPGLRVLSYNILADGYATTTFATTQLYPFCDPALLAMPYRRGRIAAEVAAYAPDIAAFQEVDRAHYERYYRAVWRDQGMDSMLALKRNGEASEGVALAFRRSRFTIVKTETLSLGWATLEQHHPALAADIARSNGDLKEALGFVPSVGLLAVVHDRATGVDLVVVNTHLFYHPDGCHIRALQGFMLATEAQRLCGEHGDCRSVLCGDFNSTHLGGVSRLLCGGRLGHDATTNCWEKGACFWWGCDRGLVTAQSELTADDEALVAAAEDAMARGDTSASHRSHHDGSGDGAASPDGPVEPQAPFFTAELSLRHRYTATHEHPMALPFTVFGGFTGTLDHVFVSDGLQVGWVLPGPTAGDLAPHSIPTAAYPSDHVALLCDIAPLCPNAPAC